MLSRSRRRFLVGSCASLLYGLKASHATEAPNAPSAHIALILPLDSPAFARAADAVRQGFLAAARVTGPAVLPVIGYAHRDDASNLAQTVQNAVSFGAQLIVGPLTRGGVTQVAQMSIAGVRVLALNTVETLAPLPAHMYSLSLQVESEARQVARMVFANGRRNAVTLSDPAALARRSLTAFTDELTHQGARVVTQLPYRADTPDLTALRELTGSGKCDCAYLALDAARARIVRPYIDPQVQVYATSQIHDGPQDQLRDAELNGTQFVDMPWLVEPDHAAVMVFARRDTASPVASDNERLYALGIDAWRLAADLADRAVLLREPLDGVTGRITLGADRAFARELTPAQFVDGRPVPILRRN
jgi:outer membrane PBP1 activator LpoA protein